MIDVFQNMLTKNLLLMAWLPLLSANLLAAPSERQGVAAPVSSAPTQASTIYALNAVSPGATGYWKFYVAAAGDTHTENYLAVMPTIDAANEIRVVAEPNDPWRPVLEWEYGYAAGLITVRPESDRNISTKKGDLIVMWAAPAEGRYQLRLEADNVGTDVQGGDGGIITLSRLGTHETDDVTVLDRILIPASGYQSPHVKRETTVELAVGERIVMRLNAGIDGFGDLWRVRYAIVRKRTT